MPRDLFGTFFSTICEIYNIPTVDEFIQTLSDANTQSQRYVSLGQEILEERHARSAQQQKKVEAINKLTAEEQAARQAILTSQPAPQAIWQLAATASAAERAQKKAAVIKTANINCLAGTIFHAVKQQEQIKEAQEWDDADTSLTTNAQASLPDDGAMKI